MRTVLIVLCGLLVAAGAVVAAGTASPARLASSEGAAGGDKAALGKGIREFLIANPEVLVEAMQELERKLHVSERRGALRLKRRWGRGGAAPSGRGALCVCGAPIHSR